jgi:hypothetical protein
VSAQSSAIISSCGRYRYLLSREWEPMGAACTFIMLNPSTADGTLDDPTIRRCIGFAKAWRYGGMSVVNLFALRATDPRDLSRWSRDNSVGPLNDKFIDETIAATRGVIVAAWGAGGHLYGRAQEVVDRHRGRLMRLGTPTLNGSPKHPLYLSARTMLQEHS